MIKKDMTNADYHAHPATGRTAIVSALKSARSYKRAVDGEFEQTASMALGDAVHAYVLEPKRFEEMYDLDTNRSGEEFLNPRLDGVMKITPAEYVKFKNAVEALDQCQEFQDLLAKSRGVEASFFANIDSEELKVRPDFLSTLDGLWCVDLKTVGGMNDLPSSPNNFSKSFFDHGYDVQMVMYTSVIEECIEKNLNGFIFVCVDVKKEYAGVKIYRFTRGESQWWAIGSQRLQEGLELVKEYRAYTEFPVYEKVTEDDLPLSYNAANYVADKGI